MEATAICVPIKEHDSLATDADSINLAYPGNRKSRAKSQTHTHTQGVLMDSDFVVLRLRHARLQLQQAICHPLWQQTIVISGRGLRARVACVARQTRMPASRHLGVHPNDIFRKNHSRTLSTHTFGMRDVFVWLN